MTRDTRTWLLTASLAAALSLFATGEARASLIGVNATVTLVEPPFPDESDAVTVGAGFEIAEGDGSNIGGLLLEGEYFDLGASSIVYRVRGDGDPHSPGYSFTNFGDDAHFVFAFDLAPGNQILSVMVVLQDVIGVAVGSEVFLSASGDAVTLYVDTLGVREAAGVPDLGTIRLDLTFQSTEPPVGAVPEPSSLAALGLGLLAFAWRRHRQG